MGNKTGQVETLNVKLMYLALTVLKITKSQGAWVAQWVEHPTLGFGSGHDLRVMRLSPMSSSVLSEESA